MRHFLVEYNGRKSKECLRNLAKAKTAAALASSPD